MIERETRDFAAGPVLLAMDSVDGRWVVIESVEMADLGRRIHELGDRFRWPPNQMPWL